MPLSSSYKKPLVIISCLLGLIVLLTAVGLCYYLTSPSKAGSPEQIFLVADGSTLERVADNLEEKGIISRKDIFLLYARAMGYGRKIKAGEYRLSPGMSPLRILDILNRGAIVFHTVTIPEGFTREQIGALLEQKGLAAKKAFMAVTGDEAVTESYGITGPDLEGYLYPDTYRFSRGLSEKSIVDVMVRHFFEVFSTYRDRLKDVGMTMEQVVVLASIVEKETGKAEERPVIASVFLNRLRKRMRLESDPTVIYGIDNFDGNLRKKDLVRDNPYNTCVIRGLPPGAIANPGEDAIRAVLHPADMEYLYFVSKNDGSHHFSKTFNEHVKAKKKYMGR